MDLTVSKEGPRTKESYTMAMVDKRTFLCHFFLAVPFLALRCIRVGWVTLGGELVVSRLAFQRGFDPSLPSKTTYTR